MEFPRGGKQSKGCLRDCGEAWGGPVLGRPGPALGLSDPRHSMLCLTTALGWGH